MKPLTYQQRKNRDRARRAVGGERLRCRWCSYSRPVGLPSELDRIVEHAIHVHPVEYDVAVGGPDGDDDGVLWSEVAVAGPPYPPIERGQAS